jgi:multidrug efflux pump subunit AcrB
MSIPLTFLSVFFIMNTAGITLNFLSLFALILSLGMLMDDAIVIVESMSRYYKTGKFTADEAGLLVWRDFIVPIWSTTITTIWAFIPLLLSSGITGEFIKSIPIVVTAALMSSTFTAVLITLPLMMRLMDLKVAYRVKILFAIFLFIALISGFVWLVPVTWLIVIEILVFLVTLAITFKVRRQLAEKISFTKWSKYLHLLEGGFFNLDKVTTGYRKVLDKILSSLYWRKRVVWIVLLLAIFSYTLPFLGFVKSEFFPKTDMDLVYLGLELSSGTASRKTEQETYQILEKVRLIEGIDYATGEVGYKIGVDGVGSSGSNLATITIKLVDEKKRDLSSIEIADNLRKMFANFSGGRLDVVELSGGPPAGADVEIRILGDDLSKIESFSDEAVNYLTSKPGVINVDKSVKPGISKLGFEPDLIKLSEASINPSSLGFWMRSFLSGFELDEVKFNGDKEKVMFYFDRGLLSSDQLDRLMVPGANGPVPLSSLGKFVLKANPEKISREDGKRVVTVSASVEKGFVAADINKGLISFTDKMNIPAGYEWRTGGANEENQKSITSIIQAMGLAAILILITMVLQLGSYRKALIVLMVIPLAVSGVFVMFGLTGTPLSFPSLIGMLALFGIVVNNSIMVVERINQNVKQGIDFKTAVIEASAGRVEPIAFSSMTTILGLTPISLSDPLWRGLGGAIISGLIFSGAIMLFFIPVVYYSWFKVENHTPRV